MTRYALPWAMHKKLARTVRVEKTGKVRVNLTLSEQDATLVEQAAALENKPVTTWSHQVVIRVARAVTRAGDSS